MADRCPPWLRLRCLCLTLAIVALTLSARPALFAAGPGSQKPHLVLSDGDRVVFLGNTLIERAQKYGHWEAALSARFPEANVIFRNLGWDGDTVWAESRGMFDPPAKGYQRMLERIRGIRPTVVFLGYGNNEAHSGLGGLPRFLDRYRKLMDDVAKASAEEVRFVIIPPLPREHRNPMHPDPEAYNRVVLKYAEALEKLADDRGALFPRPHEYVAIVGNLRKDGEKVRYLTGNGMHLSDFGYRQVGQSMMTWLLNDNVGYTYLHLSADGKVVKTERAKVTDVKRGPAGLSWRMTCTMLPADEMYWSFSDLEPGRYALRVDGKTLHTATAAEWGDVAISASGPAPERYEKLRRAIIEKNRLYFHSWRPQNITYLFGFRKHEQGQNAKEVAEFEKLVAEKEAEIARLKKDVPTRFELVRVAEKRGASDEK